MSLRNAVNLPNDHISISDVAVERRNDSSPPASAWNHLECTFVCSSSLGFLIFFPIRPQPHSLVGSPPPPMAVMAVEYASCRETQRGLDPSQPLPPGVGPGVGLRFLGKGAPFIQM